MSIECQNLLKNTNAQTSVLTLDNLSALSNFVAQHVKTSDLQNDAGFLSSCCYEFVESNYDAEINGFVILPQKTNVLVFPEFPSQNNDTIQEANIILESFSVENDYQIVCQTPAYFATNVKLLIEQNGEVDEDEYLSQQIGTVSPNQLYSVQIHNGNVQLNQSDNMITRQMAVLNIKQDIATSLYGYDYNIVLKDIIGSVFAVDNSVNVVQFDPDDIRFFSYKIVFPQYQCAYDFDERRMRRFVVQFSGDTKVNPDDDWSMHIQVQIPFIDVDGNPIRYNLAKGVNWSDLYVLRHNCQYEFTETAPSVFKLNVREIKFENSDNIVIDVPLFNWHEMNYLDNNFKNYFAERMQNVLAGYSCWGDIRECNYDGHELSGAPASFVEGEQPIGFLLRDYMSITNLIGPAWSYYPTGDKNAQAALIFLPGFSNVPISYYDFLHMLIISRFDGCPADQQLLSEELTRPLYQFIKANCGATLVQNSYGIFMRLKFNQQASVVLPPALLAHIEAVAVLIKNQQGVSLYSEKSCQSHIGNIIDTETVNGDEKSLILKQYIDENIGDRYIIVYLPNEAEDDSAIFFKYNKDNDEYSPAFLNTSASSLPEAFYWYRYSILFSKAKIIVDAVDEIEFADLFSNV